MAKKGIPSVISDKILAVAKEDIGTAEWPGAKQNPDILQMYAYAGVPQKADEVPWCAAFVGSVLAKVGIQGTGSLAARSYCKWGHAVDIEDARPGDVVVFWREDPKSWKGHVAFYYEMRPNGRQIRVIGGNQKNKVSVQDYPAKTLLAVRRPKAPRSSIAQSKTMQAGTVTATAIAGKGFLLLQSLDGHSLLIALGLLTVAALGIAVIFRERVGSWIDRSLR